MASRAEAADSEGIRRERDLYLRLLSLGDANELEPFLRETLALLVDITGAQHAYIELRDGEGETAWQVAHGYSSDQIEEIRSRISTGILSEAIATGITVLTPSALSEARFKDRGSVKFAEIASVLCAPIGGEHPIGAVYLQADSVNQFSESDRLLVEMLSRRVAPFADRLIARVRTRSEADPLAEFRRANRFSNIVGRSPALAFTLQQAASLATLDVTILLTGESGTGKSQLARAIHDESPRAAHPFVELNCAALPEPLLESELFGAVQGAHSTATRRVPGKIEVAENGTFFLDEVAELPLGSQAKLLNFCQSREYYPLGSSVARSANVRILAATNADLEKLVKEGRFRQDLLYRLQVVKIRMPSLVERREDVRELAEHLCREACKRHGLPFMRLSPGALLEIESTVWPGNIRQLTNAIESGAIQAAAAGLFEIERSHLFESLTEADGPIPVTFQGATRQFQADLVRRTLADTEWNIAETARRLDLARQYVHKLIRRFGLKRTN